MDNLTSLLDTFGDRTHSNTPLIITVLVSVLASILLFTRIVSTTGRDGSNSPPAVPYWLPFFGHLPNMAIDGQAFAARLRDTYRQGIFAVNFFGKQHNVVSKPGLAAALLNQKSEYVNSDAVSEMMLRNVFGWRSSMDKWDEGKEELFTCYSYLLKEPSLSEMVDKTATKLREIVVNLVSFASSPVDEMPWERKSNNKIVKDRAGETVVEASLMPLIRDFCAHAAIPTIMGSDFLANFPDFTTSLWNMDRGFILLATGLPRWFPIPALTRAHLARRKVLDNLAVFHTSLEKAVQGQDPGSQWRTLAEDNDVGTIVMARMEVYHKYNWNIQDRAVCEGSLLWASNANSNALVFWMLNRMYADTDLLGRIRAEIAPYVHAIQPTSELPIPEAPRLEKLDVEGLCAHCPLLKSCYIECLRVDAASWSFKAVKKDFVLQSREKDAQPWMLKKGQYAHAAHDLHNMDPEYFHDPSVWKADRHIKFDSHTKRDVADMGSIRPYGEFQSV